MQKEIIKALALKYNCTEKEIEDCLHANGKFTIKCLKEGKTVKMFKIGKFVKIDKIKVFRAGDAGRPERESKTPKKQLNPNPKSRRTKKND